MKGSSVGLRIFISSSFTKRRVESNDGRLEAGGPLIVITGDPPWSSDLERLIAGGAETFLSVLTVKDLRGPKVRNVALGVLCAVGMEEMLLR